MCDGTVIHCIRQVRRGVRSCVRREKERENSRNRINTWRGFVFSFGSLIGRPRESRRKPTTRRSRLLIRRPLHVGRARLFQFVIFLPVGTRADVTRAVSLARVSFVATRCHALGVSFKAPAFSSLICFERTSEKPRSISLCSRAPHKKKTKTNLPPFS